jgi:hypothetical protein
MTSERDMEQQMSPSQMSDQDPREHVRPATCRPSQRALVEASLLRLPPRPRGEGPNAKQ